MVWVLTTCASASVRKAEEWQSRSPKYAQTEKARIEYSATQLSVYMLNLYMYMHMWEGAFFLSFDSLYLAA